jgi:hypothetical protein
MTEIYENFDAKKKSLYFKDDGTIDEGRLKKRSNSRVKEYAFGYCSLETGFGEDAVSKVENVGRFEMERNFICLVIVVFIIVIIVYFF